MPNGRMVFKKSLNVNNDHKDTRSNFHILPKKVLQPLNILSILSPFIDQDWWIIQGFLTSRK